MTGMKVNLTVVEGPEKGKSFFFAEPEKFFLGRNAFMQYRIYEAIEVFTNRENIEGSEKR